MVVLFLRHATAEGHGARLDAERALVEKGWKQAKRAADFCKAHGIVPDVVLTSPLRRAVETATAFAEGTGVAAPEVVGWLSPGRAAAEALEELVAYRQHPVVCVVGHEPDFSGLVAEMIGARAAGVHVRKASLIAVECVRPAAGRGTLEFLVPNDMMK